MRPDLLLDARNDLNRRLHDDVFINQVRISTMWGSENETFGVAQATDWRQQQWPQALETLQRSVPMAEVYRVTEPVTHIVEALANGMSGIEHVPRRDEVNSYHGIVYFERPLPVYDVRGNRMLVHWITWSPVNVGDENNPAHNRDEEMGDAGFLITHWNDVQVEPDEVMQSMGPSGLAEHMRYMGRWAPMGLDVTVVDARVGPPYVEPTDEQIAKLIADGVPRDVAENGSTNTLRIVVALWTLLGQTLTELREERPRKRKRFGPQRMPTPESVTVVTLRRRASDPDHDPTNVEWQHRWLVRGHPRQQRYGPNNQWVKTIWIAPHIKGPDDKPLVITRKVYDLRR